MKGDTTTIKRCVNCGYSHYIEDGKSLYIECEECGECESINQ